MIASTGTATPEPNPSTSFGPPRQSTNEDSVPERPAPGAEFGVDCRGGPFTSSSPRAASSLQRLVGDVDRFSEEYWGRLPLVAADHDAAGAAQAFGDIFSLEAVDDLLASAARAPTIRMVAAGEPLPLTQYCSRLRLGGRDLDDIVDPLKVVDRLAEGATLVLQSLHRTCPAVSAFVRDLQHELSHPVQANAYLTPPSAAGLAEHSDLHDVLAVQISGAKQWWIDGLGDITMQPGDVVYIPSGTRHRAATATTTSLHLTLGIIRVSYRQVIQRILATAAPELDVPLPIGYRHRPSRRALEAGIDAALDHVLDLVGSTDPDGVADREQHRRMSSPTTPGRITSIARADQLTADSVIRWVAPEPLARAVDQFDGRLGHWDDLRGHDHWSPEPERVIVDLGDRTLALPTTTLAALRDLARGRPVRVADLDGLDEPSRLVLARRLIREGACVIQEA